MRLFFAGFYEQNAYKWIDPEIMKSCCVLGSYFYLASKHKRKDFDPTLPRDFLLDCGAFSFVFGSNTAGASRGINWKEYVRNYADFVKEFKIQKYLEIDIDAIVGYDRVVYYRNMLEDLVGWPCIPVYHVGRTDEQFVESCQGRPYVCYGTNIGEAAKNNPNVARIANMAHEQGCRIHLLGVSDPMPLKETGIIVDSCDSTSWLLGCTYGRRLNWKPGDTKMTNYNIARTEQLSPTWREKAYSLSAWRKCAKWMAQNVDIIWPEDVNYPHVSEDDMTEEELLEKYKTVPRRD